MEISPLVDFLASESKNSERFLYQLASMHLAEWHHLYPCWTVEEAVADFKIHKKAAIPLTLIAHEGGCFRGSASLLESDAPAFFPLGPWFANLFVVSEARKKGIGTLLLYQTMKLAQSLDISKLYLFTEYGESFYLKHGWGILRGDFLENHPVVIMYADLQTWNCGE